MNDEKIIRKKYGEQMWHYCRRVFSTILERPGVLSNILLNNFYPSKKLYESLLFNEEMDDFASFIYSKFNMEVFKFREEGEVETPEVLMKRAGYNLYDCQNEDDIQSFSKYYEEEEKLCTFNGNRLESCYVFFAVKDNVDEIKRENFLNPQRQDEYGTSVISIQFSKDALNILSIKNRYNHVVDSPDATFSNNLDEIIPDLTYSFDKHYGLKQRGLKNTRFSSCVLANDGIHYTLLCRKDDVCYCDGNIIVDKSNVIDTYANNRERYLIAGYFIIDMKENTISSYDPTLEKSLISIEKDITKIDVTLLENGKKCITFHHDYGDSYLYLEDSYPVKYVNNCVEEIDELCFIDISMDIEMKSLKSIKGDVSYGVGINEGICLGSLKKVGGNVNTDLGENFSNLIFVGGDFNSGYVSFEHLSNLEYIGGNANFPYLKDSNGLSNLRYIGGNACFSSLRYGEGLYNLTEIGGDANFEHLIKASGLTKLEKIGGNANFKCLDSANGLENLKWIGNNANFDDLYTPSGLNNLRNIGGDAIFKELEVSSGLESLESIGGSARFAVLEDARGLRSLSFIGGDARFGSLEYADGLENLKHIGGKVDLSFLKSSRGLESLTVVNGEMDCSSLKDAVGFVSLLKIPSHSNFESLTSSTGFDSVEEIGDAVSFDALSDISGFSSLGKVGDFIKFSQYMSDEAREYISNLRTDNILNPNESSYGGKAV